MNKNFAKFLEYFKMLFIKILKILPKRQKIKIKERPYCSTTFLKSPFFGWFHQMATKKTQKIPFLVPDPSLGIIPSVLVYSMHPRRHGTLVSRIPKGLLCVAFADSTIYCLHTEPVDSLAWTIILRLDNNIQCFIKRKKVKKPKTDIIVRPKN